MSKIRTVTTTMLVLASVLSTGSASAGSASVAITSATPNGSRATVTGTASFVDATVAQDLGGTRTVSASGDTPLHPIGGVDVRRTEAAQIAEGVRLTMYVADLPATALPEGVRYYWYFKIGDLFYRVLAKRMDVLGLPTEDPAGWAARAAAGGPFIELTGPCFWGPALFECPHAEYIDGFFDVSGDRIVADVPFEHVGSIGALIAEGIKPGATLSFGEIGWDGVGSRFEGSVATGTTTVELKGVRDFYIGPNVALGFSQADRQPDAVSYTQQATLAPDGSFSADVDGRVGERSTLFVRACSGAVCAFDKVTLPPGEIPSIDPGGPILKSANVTAASRVPYTGGTEVDFDGDRYLYAGQWDGKFSRDEFPDQGGIRIVDLKAPQADGTTGPSTVGLLDCPGTDNYVRYLDPAIYNSPSHDKKFIAVAFHGNVCTRTMLKDDPNAGPWGIDFNGIMTVDVTDPVRPKIVSAVGHDSAHTLKPHPTKPYIYVLPGGTTNGTAINGHNRVSPTGIVDASDPTHLRYVRAFEHNASGCHDLGFSNDGRWAYCAGLGEVQIWDVADPENPLVAGSIVNPAIQFAHNAVVSPDGRYVLINDEAFGFHTCTDSGADLYGSLWIYDITIPQAPVLAGRIAPPAHPTSPANVFDWAASWCTAHNYNFIPGTSIVVTSWFAGGTTVYDIADPMQPKKLAFYQPADGVAWSAQYFGGHVVINDMARGLEILDIAGLGTAAEQGGSATAAPRIDRTAELLPAWLPPRASRAQTFKPNRAYFCAPIDSRVDVG